MTTLEDARRTARAQARPADASQLRLLACGSVDDGKSTLLGRLLFDTDAVPDDQLSALDRDSRRWGTDGDARDYALLLDGLSAEREQGITIDVAYRYFSTPRRSFIVADTPGHEQYTRNMATGASNADLAIILVDARKGLLPQTRRHAFIAATLGIRHAVLAVNKMDLVDFSEARFAELADAFAVTTAPARLPLGRADPDLRQGRRQHRRALPAHALVPRPDPARSPRDRRRRAGAPSPARSGCRCSWSSARMRISAAMPEPWPPAPSASATKSWHSPAAQAPKSRASSPPPATATTAGAGEAVTLTLSAEIDVSRGDVLAAAGAPPAISARLRATLLWMAPNSLMTGREFRLQLGPATANAKVWQINHEVDIESYERRPATWLPLNGIGSVDLLLDRPLPAAPYAGDRALGALILVDRVSNATVALGVIEEVLPNETPRPVTASAITRWRRPILASVTSGAAMAALAGILSRDVALAVELSFANMLLAPLAARITHGPK